mmetsp:Transcript_16279/g.22831  ORF Transcript_16279/g.22831 Transcript_16279/m.22831 type:complete len:248 (+) Transcript_16279:53-796(+)|eukprot:CAMPEP_0185259158 /NCGR_PEP_ID=MMETSP1359-20130426/7986_1 /TAXON_ID=552665 /ORGANISM="Bigelowiella longifila, Strain CCMP242" /LENGTH=247 /DNA_ID=CAMNT_0027844959 /DNA_START=47 /DNA_END=790 /DNA_ORIENTATION=+
MSLKILTRITRASKWSRRNVFKLLREGKCFVDGTVTFENIKVLPGQKIVCDGQDIPEIKSPRLFRYHKQRGELVTLRDTHGRTTVFDKIPIPDDIQKLIAVGRLDFDTEGLLLFSSCGLLSRRLELPKNRFQRVYEAKVLGTPNEEKIEELRHGTKIDGIQYRSIDITPILTPSAWISDDVDSTFHARWMRVVVSEGKKREVRRALAAADLDVNRLIRVRYGPFDLAGLEPGDFEETSLDLLEIDAE